MEEKKNYFVRIGIPALILTLAGIVVLLFILLLPQNRANRLIMKANELFVAEEYDKAGAKYLKAVSVEPERLDAWYRATLCAQNSEESETEVFANARQAANKLLYEQLSAEDRGFVTDLYLLTPEIIETEQERLEVLLEGYRLLREDEGLKPAISDVYLGLANKAKDTSVREAVSLFEKAYEYGNGAENIMTAASASLYEAVLGYADEDDFDEAFRLLDAYENYMDEGATARAYTEERKKLFDLKERVLSTSYNAMISYYEKAKESFSPEKVKEDKSLDFGMFSEDWETMLRLDGSDDAEFLAYYGDGRFIWAPGGAKADYTGVGAGLFAYGGDEEGKNRSYCFYVGEFVNGERSGFGINFAKTGTSAYYAYEGHFLGDKANGEGINYRSSNYAYTSLVEYRSVTLGTYRDGLEDGQIVVCATTGETPGAFFEGAYMASNGFAEGADSLLNIYSIEAGDGRTLISVLTDSTYGYGFYMPYYQTDGVAMTALGY